MPRGSKNKSAVLFNGGKGYRIAFSEIDRIFRRNET
jgi:hypothetical protein